MKIYIVCDNNDYRLCGVFLDKAKAEEQAYLIGECNVVEYDTDKTEDGQLVEA